MLLKPSGGMGEGEGGEERRGRGCGGGGGRGVGGHIKRWRGRCEVAVL